MIDRALFKLPGVRRILPVIGILAFLQSAVIFGQALFLSASIVGFWQSKPIQHIIPDVIGFALCFIGRELVNFIRQTFLDKFAYRLAENYRQEMLDKIFELGPSMTEKMGTGGLASTVISGIDNVENYIKLVLSKVLNMMIVPIFIWIGILFLEWESALTLAIAFPFAIIFMILLGYAAQGRAEKQYKSFMILSNHFLDSLRGIATLRYFGLSKRYAGSIYRTSERFRKATMSTLSMAMLSTFALDAFATLSVATVALFLGIKLLDGHILLFPALATLILAPEFFLPLREFAGDYHATLNGKNAFSSVQKTLNTENVLSKDLSNSVKWSDESTFALSNLTKTYETGRGISDVNFELTGFNKVALVGASGSGKSTLISMLAGFLDATNGEFIINGQKLTTLADENFRKSLQFIPQNTYIFSGTLRENLKFYTPEASDDEILAAAKLAGLSDLIENVGLDTKIGSAGRTLSGGQMQRVALTRAFLSNDRNILFLDEPTAHLDIETELEIKANILPLLENKLVFLATHRLHWLPQMDKVLVLNEGKVEGFGTHEELLAENAYYQRLVEEMRG